MSFETALEELEAVIAPLFDEIRSKELTNIELTTIQ